MSQCGRTTSGLSDAYGPPHHDDDAAPPELLGNTLHAAPLADFARDTDKVDGGVEIDRRHVLVAKPNLKMARCQGGDRRNREVGHRSRRRNAPGPEHLGAEIARKVGKRID
jgi:hypothetical protein